MNANNTDSSAHTNIIVTPHTTPNIYYMHAMCLETPVGGAQHLWVLDRGIVKRLRIHPTLKQLEWLVLASPMALLPVEVTIVRWHNGAFEADVHSIHVLPHTKQRVPPYKGTLRMTRRIYSRK